MHNFIVFYYARIVKIIIFDKEIIKEMKDKTIEGTLKFKFNVF